VGGSTAPRAALSTIFRAAVAAVGGRQRVHDALLTDPPAGSVSLVAIGKAACAMAEGAVDVLGAGLIDGLVVAKPGYGTPLPARLELIEAGHPLPDAGSLVAGRRLLAFLDACPADHLLLFLISGGASSLVEVLPQGVGLDDLQRANAWLLGSGLSIDAMNRVRGDLSAVKAGRLGAALGGRSVRALMISDVPEDDPTVIGSGLLSPAAQRAPLPALPDWLQSLVARAPPAPGPAHPGLAGVRVEIVAALADAKAAAAASAAAQGLAVHVVEPFLDGEARAAGERVARALIAGPAGLTVWGGETTVRLPARPGRGGRNQTVAVAAALALAGRPNCALLAAGTDGSDGPTLDAGGIVDGGTVARGHAAGLSPLEALERADTGPFLAAAGDLVRTGPTGTNVMDLVLGLKLAEHS
jgi:hydroxypyruvate reductase